MSVEFGLLTMVDTIGGGRYKPSCTSFRSGHCARPGARRRLTLIATPPAGTPRVVVTSRIRRSSQPGHRLNDLGAHLAGGNDRRR
jgi:hypothetical protein